MTDLATLGLAIDSTQVRQGAGELDKLTVAGAKAEAAVDRLGDAASQTGTQVKSASAAAAQYAADIQRMANNTRLTGTHVDSLGASTKATRAHMANLSFQLQDIGVQLASGQNPLMILAQQGSQVVGIFQMAGDAAGELAYKVGFLIGRFLPIAAAIGVAYAALKLFQDELNDQAPADQFIRTLGLTDKEMKKLKDTTITTGDIFTGLWKVIADRTGVDESIADFKSYMISQFAEAVKGAGKAIAAIYGETVGTYRAISQVWNDLPAMFAATFARAVNAAAAKLEGFINGAIGAINRMAAAANALVGAKLFGSIGTVALPRMEADFSKSFGNVKGIIKGEIASATAEAQGAINGFVADVAKAAEDARDTRLRAQADDIIADRTQKAAKAHRDRASAADKEAERLRKLWEARQALLDQPQDISRDLLNADQQPLDTVDLSLANSLTTLVDPAQQLLDTLSAISDQSQITAQIMGEAFGNVGDVFGNILSGMADFQLQSVALSQAVAKGAITQGNAEKMLSTLRAKNTAMALSGLKSLFKEHSTGYKVMSAVEKAYAAFQAVQTALSIARDIAKTTSAVAQSGIRTAANTTEGASKIFAELGPWAFPVVAAMIAVLASLGFRGGGGGSGSTPPTSAQDLQDQAGTGTVLGDSKAKSESIARSLELVAANTNRDLEYSNAMLKALRNIDTSIAKMAGTVAKQISVSGSLFDTSGQNLGTNSKGGFLGIGGSVTTRNLYDLGVQFGAMTVGSIIDQGISGQSYQVIEKIKKKKGFLGIGSSTKTTYSTTYGAIDPEITSAIQDVIGSLRDALVAGADVIGLQGAQAILDSFSINLGKISFKDMTGQEIEDQLNAIFSSIGDQMADKLLPSLKDMQLVGEGLFETFMRVAKEYQAVDIALKSIGRSFGAVGIESVAARDALVQLFGGLDDFLEATDFFRDQFLTEAEQIAPIMTAVRDEMTRLGLAGITTRDQFKQAVLGLDLTTTAGREMYAALLAVAPAFDKVLDYVEQANKAQIQTLQSTLDQFTKFAESLKKYRDTLFATETAQGNAYGILKQRFLETAALAATGDATALGGLESSAKTFLDAARANASSREQYLRDVAMVAQGVDRGIFAAEETADYAQLQLDALQNAVSILAEISSNTAATAGALGATTVVPTPAGTAPAGSESSGPTPSEQQIIDQNQTLIEQNAQIVTLLQQQQRWWNRVEGEGMLIRGETDTPVYTTAAP